MLVGSVERYEGYLYWLEVWKGMKDICIGWKCGRV